MEGIISVYVGELDFGGCIRSIRDVRIFLFVYRLDGQSRRRCRVQLVGIALLTERPVLSGSFSRLTHR